MISPSIILSHLAITGPQVKIAFLDFKDGLNLVYGASNTGKSLILQSIDFMLGASDTLPDIKESEGYEKIFLGFKIRAEQDKEYTLERAISGGGFFLYKGLITSSDSQLLIDKLLPSLDEKNEHNISTFLLNNLSLKKRMIVKNSFGEKNNLSFRDLVPFSFIDETSIQVNKSPVETNLGPVTKTKERSTFRMLVSGVDDSSIIPLVDDKTFSISKNAKTEVIAGFIDDLNQKIAEKFPDADDLVNQLERLSEHLEMIQKKYNDVQSLLNNDLQHKQSILLKKTFLKEKVLDVSIDIERFEKLNKIYSSDVERLHALDEASFLFSLGVKDNCSLCGAEFKDQKIVKPAIAIEEIQISANAEIEKIKVQQKDLLVAIEDLKTKKNNLELQIKDIESSIALIDESIAKLSKSLTENSLSLKDYLLKRDNIKEGIDLLEQRANYQIILQNIESMKKTSKSDKPKLKTNDSKMYDLCGVIKKVLIAWNFPGSCDISFDEQSFDFKIDGKARISNGKGIRAITHAAFKVGLLIYCKERNLPHPGFVIIDTPLLTYRDPIKNPKHGPLSDDEKKLAQTPLCEKFFEHLASLKNVGQFIILENIDPSEKTKGIAHCHLFCGSHESNDRFGLFPLAAT